MGNEASLHLDLATNFDAEEIKRLGKRFKKLDLDNSGSLSVEEFMTLPGMPNHSLFISRIQIKIWNPKFQSFNKIHSFKESSTSSTRMETARSTSKSLFRFVCSKRNQSTFFMINDLFRHNREIHTKKNTYFLCWQ